MSTVVVFAPHAGFWEHIYSTAQIAEGLAQEGHKIIFVSCEEDLNDHCIIISSIFKTSATPEQKKATCANCIKNKNLIKNNFNFEFTTLSQYINSEDKTAAQQFSKSSDYENILSNSYKDYKIGQYALYESLLIYKRLNTELIPEQKTFVQNSVKTCYLNIKAAERIIEKYKPTYLAVYNSAYSTNRAVYEVAKKNNIRTISMHSGLNLTHAYETMILPIDYTYNYFKHAKEYWTAIKDIPLGKRATELVLNHFKPLFSGNSVWAWSAPKQTQFVNIREKLDIPVDKKLIIMTLSSYDERFASETCDLFPKYDNLLFELQVDWIRETIQWAKNKKDVYLLIRVHPRELPNKRESVLSQHAQLLAEALSDLPSNVKINWPTDNISIYDLALTTDVVLNAWSSAGAELSVFGIPVVVYSKELPLYPADINYCGETRIDYFEQIELALKKPFEPERIRMSVRWLYFLLNGLTVNLAHPAEVKYTRKNLLFWIDKILKKIFKKDIFLLIRLKLKSRKNKDSSLINSWFKMGLPPIDEIKKHKYSTTSLETENKVLSKFLKNFLDSLHVNDPHINSERVKWLRNLSENQFKM